MSEQPNNDQEKSQNADDGNNKETNLENTIQQNFDDSTLSGGVQAISGDGSSQTSANSTGNNVTINLGDVISSRFRDGSEFRLPKISRKDFIFLAAGTAVAVPACAAIARKDRVHWNMGSFFEETGPNLILKRAPQMICDKVYKMTDGAFKITIDHSVGSDTDKLITEVQAGKKIQCSYSGIYYGNQHKALWFGSSIPFGLNPQEQNAWLSYKKKPEDEENYPLYEELNSVLGEEPTLMQIMYRKILNLLAFPAGATGAQMGGWFHEEIKLLNKGIVTLEENKPISMRVPGLGAIILSQLGVETQHFHPTGRSLKISEFLEKFRDKTIDAVEWIGPHDDIELGLDKIGKYYYCPGWWEPGSTFHLHVNIEKWQKLPDHYKIILKSACLETHTEILYKYDQKNSESLQTIDQSRIKYFDTNILNAARSKTTLAIERAVKYDDESKNFKYIYCEWKRFREQIQPWSNLNKIEPSNIPIFTQCSLDNEAPEDN